MPQRLEANERITVEVTEPDRVKKMLLGGELRDGKTIATLGAYFMGTLCPGSVTGNSNS